MCRIIIACALISLATAAVLPDDAQARIVSYQNDNDGLGNYEFSFETSNGITRSETGRLINAGQDNQYVLVEGSYSYIDVDGQLVKVEYRADEDGYHILPPRALYGLPANVVATLLGK